MNLVFDIEANGLLNEVTKFHCAGAIDTRTGKEYWFKNSREDFVSFLNLLSKADVVIAHNAFGYDIPALTKLTGWQPKATVHCTKVMSQLQNFTRFGFGHSLKKWGEFFKDYKGDYEGGWEEFNEDMFNYMKQDVKLGVKVFEYLTKELKRIIQNSNGKNHILMALRSEMEMDRIMVKQCTNGWPFNVEAARELADSIEKQLKDIESYINPKLGCVANSPDGSVKKIKEAIQELKDKGETYDNNGHGWPTVPSKKPAFKKSGKYYSHTESWFGGFDPSSYDLSDKSSLPVWGEYTRISLDAGDVGNTDTVKTYLYSIGWQPDDWNWKKVEGEFVRVSPKLTDSSLQKLGDVGKALTEYYTLRSRYSILKGWFEYIDKNSKLHGDVFNIGTPTFRQTHKIIANLPSGKAVLGPEFRKLFITREGYKLVSADSAACQLRLLAHFMKDQDFTKEVLEGDIHQKNADILGCSRATAKPFIFAFLYGAGGRKLGSILNVSEAEGNKAKKKFMDAIPSLKRLIDDVKTAAEEEGKIFGLDGRPTLSNLSLK